MSVSEMHTSQVLRVREAQDLIRTKQRPNSIEYGLMVTAFGGGFLGAVAGDMAGKAYDYFFDTCVEVVCEASPLAETARWVGGAAGLVLGFAIPVCWETSVSNAWHRSLKALGTSPEKMFSMEKFKTSTRTIATSTQIAALLNNSTKAMWDLIVPKLSPGQLVEAEKALTNKTIKRYLQTTISTLPKEIVEKAKAQERIDLEKNTLRDVIRTIDLCRDVNGKDGIFAENAEFVETMNTCDQLFGVQANEFLYEYLSRRITVDNLKAMHAFAEYRGINALLKDCTRICRQQQAKAQSDAYFSSDRSISN